MDLKDRVKNDSRSKIVEQLKNGKVIATFPSVHRASLSAKINYDTLTNWCKNPQKTFSTGEFSWRYKNE